MSSDCTCHFQKDLFILEKHNHVKVKTLEKCRLQFVWRLARIHVLKRREMPLVMLWSA